MLAGVVALAATAMAVAAVLALSGALSRESVVALNGAEIVAAALLVLPWFAAYAWRAAGRFSPGDAAERAWRALGCASALLLAGQVCSYLPAALDLGAAEPWLLIAGQVLPAAFRVVLCWALWRMRSAYLATGIHFRLRPFDYAAAAAVAALAVVLVVRRDVLFDYWSADTAFTAATRAAMTWAQVFNFFLYPLVFASSLAMSRYAAEMGGGLVSRAWRCVAAYGLLQPMHAFAVSLLWPTFGPLAAVVFDNFIVLAAFTCLAVGPMFQVEAAEVSRS